MSDLAIAARDCAHGLIRTARSWKSRGEHHEAARLAANARWYWHLYLREKN